MKIAFSSSIGTAVDQSFRAARSYTVWDIGPSEAYYVTTLNLGNLPDAEEDRLTARAEMLAQCAIVCCREINGPAAAKLIARNIYPLRTGGTASIEEVIARLQAVLKGNPPPWIRRAQEKELQSLRRLSAGSPT